MYRYTRDTLTLYNLARAFYRQIGRLANHNGQQRWELHSIRYRWKYSQAFRLLRRSSEASTHLLGMELLCRAPTTSRHPSQWTDVRLCLRRPRAQIQTRQWARRFRWFFLHPMGGRGLSNHRLCASVYNQNNVSLYQHRQPGCYGLIRVLAYRRCDSGFTQFKEIKTYPSQAYSHIQHVFYSYTPRTHGCNAVLAIYRIHWPFDLSPPLRQPELPII